MCRNSKDAAAEIAACLQTSCPRPHCVHLGGVGNVPRPRPPHPCGDAPSGHSARCSPLDRHAEPLWPLRSRAQGRYLHNWALSATPCCRRCRSAISSRARRGRCRARRYPPGEIQQPSNPPCTPARTLGPQRCAPPRAQAAGLRHAPRSYLSGAPALALLSYDTLFLSCASPVHHPRPHATGKKSPAAISPSAPGSARAQPVAGIPS